MSEELIIFIVMITTLVIMASVSIICDAWKTKYRIKAKNKLDIINLKSDLP